MGFRVWGFGFRGSGSDTFLHEVSTLTALVLHSMWVDTGSGGALRGVITPKVLTCQRFKCSVDCSAWPAGGNRSLYDVPANQLNVGQFFREPIRSSRTSSLGTTPRRGIPVLGRRWGLEAAVQPSLQPCPCQPRPADKRFEVDRSLTHNGKRPGGRSSRRPSPSTAKNKTLKIVKRLGNGQYEEESYARGSPPDGEGFKVLHLQSQWSRGSTWSRSSLRRGFPRALRWKARPLGDTSLPWKCRHPSGLLRGATRRPGKVARWEACWSG